MMIDKRRISSDYKRRMIYPLKIPIAFDNTRYPSLIRHLKIFKIFGGSFQLLKTDKFSRICAFSLSYAILIAAVNAVFQIHLVANFRFNGHFSPLLFLLIKLLSIFGCPFLIIILFLKRFESAKSIEKLLAIQKQLGIKEYKMFASIKVMTVLLIVATLPVVYIIGLQVELFFLIYGAATVASAASRMFHFTYLIMCVSACFDELSRTGLLVVDEFSVKRYVRIFSRLIEVSSILNSCFEGVVSYSFLVTAVDFVNAASRFWAAEVVTPIYLYKGLTPAILAHIALLHTIVACQSAIDRARDCNNFLFTTVIHRKEAFSHGVSPQIQATLLMHMGAQRTIQFEVFRSIQINYSLVISIIAAYVTYVIMMYQLDHTTPVTNHQWVVVPSSSNDTIH